MDGRIDKDVDLTEKFNEDLGKLNISSKIIRLSSQ